MRKLSLITAFVFVLVSCKEKNTEGAVEKSFSVSGTLKNTAARNVYLEESVLSTSQKVLKDSSIIDAEGKFILNTTVPGETVFNLRLGNEQFAFVSLVNDADKIKVEADFSKGYDFYSVSGSEASSKIKEYLGKSGELMREKYSLEIQLDSLKNIAGAETANAAPEQKRKELVEKLRAYTLQSVQQAKSPSLALFILATYQGQANNPNFRMNPFSSEELVGLFNEMITKFPGRADMVSIRDAIQSQIVNAVWVGKPAPEISLPDTEGKTVSLSSFRGKYVLVDFWASWCGPCRMENPNVVEAFHRFKNKNFTVLGVSLDFKKENWQRAIADDKLSWTHISDLKRWESVVVPVYKIQGIPFNVLVDPEGKVIAENLRGSFLQQKLEQVLN